jgi:hypothetical protein
MPAAPGSCPLSGHIVPWAVAGSAHSNNGRDFMVPGENEIVNFRP